MPKQKKEEKPEKGQEKKPEPPKTSRELAADFKKLSKKYIEKLEGDIEYFEKRKNVFENLAKLCKEDPKRYAKIIERLVEFG